MLLDPLKMRFFGNFLISQRILAKFETYSKLNANSYFWLKKWLWGRFRGIQESMEYCIRVLYGVLLEHFWGTFGVLLGHFWSTFGVLLKYFWSTLEYFWGTFGVLLGALLEYFWGHFWSTFEVLLEHFWSTFASVVLLEYFCTTSEIFVGIYFGILLDCLLLC